MGRNIKSYQGSFVASTSTRYQNASTGYTVPSGKVARIGFNVQAQGGTGNSGYGGARSVAGFFAGTNGAGTTSAGHNTNRILLAHSHGTDSSTVQGLSMTLHYNAATGNHKWSSGAAEYITPRMFIGDNHRERFTNRNSQDYFEFNFRNAGNVNGFGTTMWEHGENSTFIYQNHNFAYMSSGSNNANTRRVDANYYNGPAHAFAGETIYIWDCAPFGWTNANYRCWMKAQWQMFVIEEDA